MPTWTITDFRGNTVTFEAADLEDAINTSSEAPYRDRLYGNPQHWTLTSSAGDHHPQQEEYDWDLDECGYAQ